MSHDMNLLCLLRSYISNTLHHLNDLRRYNEPILTHLMVDFSPYMKDDIFICLKGDRMERTVVEHFMGLKSYYNFRNKQSSTDRKIDWSLHFQQIITLLTA